jgi:hypothetical protein
MSDGCHTAPRLRMVHWMLDAGCWKIEVKSEKQEEIIAPPNFEYPIFNF